MAAQLPLIVTNVGGNTEAVIDQVTGYIVPAKNPAILGDAILDLAFNKDKRRLFSLAGHNRVKEKFSLTSTLQAYEDFYLNLFSSIRI
jgi:glycosyltransferase involved in cell wall biosynthesis